MKGKLAVCTRKPNEGAWSAEGQDGGRGGGLHSYEASRPLRGLPDRHINIPLSVPDSGQTQGIPNFCVLS